MRQLAILALVLSPALAAGSPGGPPDFDSPRKCAEARIARALRLAAAKTMPFTPPADWALTDVLHLDLQLKADPATHRIDGVARETVRSLAPGLDRFSLRLHPSLRVISVRVDASDAAWQRTGDGSVLEVALDPPRDAGGEFEVEVTYAGVPPGAGFGESGLYFERPDGPLIYTLSEPWLAYTWWPVKEDNTDKATLDITVTVPNGLSVAANGVLAGTMDASPGWTAWHWRSRYPIAPYLVAFAAARYNTFSDTMHVGNLSMPVQFWILPSSDTPSNREGWLRAVAMLEILGPFFGGYPFTYEKYGIYEFGFGGGMEHQTATGQSGFGEVLTSHELGHQWWGDLITCATWHDIWLNEGFATYSTALWWEFRSGEDDREALRYVMDAYRPDDPDETVYVFDDSDPHRIFSFNASYEKGAWALHMLRGVTGDPRFFTILQVYRQRFGFGAATTEDFKAVVESVMEQPMDWFFDEWIYGSGAPDYRFSWRETEVDGQRYLEVGLRQVQPGRVFTMPVQIMIRGGGAAPVVTLWNTAREQTWTLPLAEDEVDSVTPDPWMWILARGWGEDTTLPPTPPRIVAVSPAPGRPAEVSPARPITVTFQENVRIGSGDVRLTDRLRGTDVPVTVSWDPDTLTATLVPETSLAPHRWILTVRDTVTAAASGLPLDGEVPGAFAHSLLPSGDGLPGGDAVIWFSAVSTDELEGGLITLPGD